MEMERAVISEWERPLRQNGATHSHKEAETAAVPMVTSAMRDWIYWCTKIHTTNTYRSYSTLV